MGVLTRQRKRKFIRDTAPKLYPTLSKSQAKEKVNSMEAEWTRVIENKEITAWKLLLKDKNLNAFNIYVELVDNSVDAKAREVNVYLRTYDNTRMISGMDVSDNGRGITDEDVHARAISFPETQFDYEFDAVGANGYGLKGIFMRLGFGDYLITKTESEKNWRMYKFTLIDKEGNRYEASEVYQYYKPSHSKFLDYKYMQQDIEKIEVKTYYISEEELLSLTNERFAEYSSGTYLSIAGMEDNQIQLSAKEFDTVQKMASIFYGQMDFTLNFKINDEEEQRILAPKFPISKQGYPSMFKDLPKFEDVKSKTSGNQYQAHYFFTLSDKHQRDESENYDAYVPKNQQWEVISDKGSTQRADGQYIIVFDENKRYVTHFKFRGNGTFWGTKHNNMNIILFAKNKLKNLDRVKFLGFADDIEEKEIRKEVLEILTKDQENKKKYLNPNWDASKQEEISQTEQLVQNIIDDVDKYRSRYIEIVADEVESVRITTKMIKDEGNWVVTKGNRYGNQIDIDQNDLKVIWELENEESAASKDHLEKINLWYDEIIQEHKDDVEWIIWVAKSHGFEKRLRDLLKQKPCVNPNFKGFKLVRWKDFRCDDDEMNVRTILANK